MTEADQTARRRPSWVDDSLYPFEDRWLTVQGADLHYVDEGDGPVMLLMHGNPTWSFLYRHVIAGLRDRYRCIAFDLPGFGLSQAPEGFGFLPSEHSAVIEEAVTQLGLSDITMMTQDWGGPIGFGLATRRPELFRAFVVGNTWAWPEANIRMASFARLLGNPIGEHEILKRNIFVEWVMPTGIKIARLSEAEWDHYRNPFPTQESRFPTYVFPREILASRETYLAEVEAGLERIAHLPALLVWPTGDIAFGEHERQRWESLFATHETVVLEGAGHYIQEDAPATIIQAITDHATLLRHG